MNRKERYESLNEALLVALRGYQKELHTALPAIVQSFNSVEMTCTAQPCLQAPIKQRDGSVQWIDLPLLLDVPVIFPSGGGFTLTFPVAAGDECLIVFSERCIDSWWQSGGYQNKLFEYRLHDLSDGFALVGARSVPSVPGAISTDSAELRSLDNVTKVKIKNGEVTILAANVKIEAGLSATITSPSIILKDTGANLSGLLNGVFADWAANHTHSGVTIGGGTTGLPTTSPPVNGTTTTVQAE